MLALAQPRSREARADAEGTRRKLAPGVWRRHRARRAVGHRLHLLQGRHATAARSAAARWRRPRPMWRSSRRARDGETGAAIYGEEAQAAAMSGLGGGPEQVHPGSPARKGKGRRTWMGRTSTRCPSEHPNGAKQGRTGAGGGTEEAEQAMMCSSKPPPGPRHKRRDRGDSVVFVVCTRRPDTTSAKQHVRHPPRPARRGGHTTAGPPLRGRDAWRRLGSIVLL